MKTAWVFITVFFVAVSGARAESKLDLYVDGEVGEMHPAESVYLGTQSGGVNTFRFVTAGGNMDWDAAVIGFRYDVGDVIKGRYLSGLKIIGRVEKAQGDDREVFPTLDPNGAALIIPVGIGVGPAGAGFLLPGANNQVTNAKFKSRFDYHKIMLGVEGDSKLFSPYFNIKPSLGLEYAQSITNNEFDGDIPFFVRSFAYDTKTKVHTVSSVIGIDTVLQINHLLSVFGDMQYALEYNEGRGKDTLAFTGFADQTASMSKYRITSRYGMSLGVEITPTERVSFSVKGNYKRLGNVPVTNNRDGKTLSDIDYEKADVFSTTARASFKF